MTLLKKIGDFIVRGIQILAGFSPIAQAALPNQTGIIQTVSQDLAQVANIIVTAEAMGTALGQPGSMKLVMATPMVAQIILQSSILAGHKVANGPLFTAGAQKIADGMADVLNSLHEDGVTATNMAA